MEKNIYGRVLETLLKELIGKGIIYDFDWYSWDDSKNEEILNVVTNDQHLITIEYNSNTINKITYEILDEENE